MTLAPKPTPAEAAFGLPLPHRRMEDWRWTDLRQLIDRPYPPRQGVKADPREVERLIKSSPFAGLAATRIVLVNGHLDAALSQRASDDVAIAVSDDDPLLRLNAAFQTDGARLRVSGTADRPIEIVHVATAAEARTIATRTVIEVTAGSSATIIETHVGAGAYLANPVTAIRLEEGARLDHVKAERESIEALHLAHCDVTLAARTVLRDFTLTSGARVNRQNGTYRFDGQGADARISGAYLLGGRQHADTRLVVDHQVPHCTSRELFKCVMDQQARGIFQGKVVVRPDAQKTDGKQSSHALLLSEMAEFDAKPELEIFADDVVCGHGATSGDLNHDHLFYLQSRGIPELEAKALLIAAFVGEAFETVDHDGLREALARFAEIWLLDHKGGH